MDGCMKVAEGVVKKEGEDAGRKEGVKDRWREIRAEMLSWAAGWQNESA